jgi:hypothetical protein
MKLLILLPILFEALSEGFYLRGERAGGPWKTISKQVQVLMIASWFLLIPLDFSWQLVALYVLARIVLFNYVHNLAAGLKLNYLGKTSLIDRIIPLVSLGNFWFLLLIQGVATLFFILLILNQL